MATSQDYMQSILAGLQKVQNEMDMDTWQVTVFLAEIDAQIWDEISELEDN